MCGLAIATPFYDHVRMYEITNLVRLMLAIVSPPFTLLYS